MAFTKHMKRCKTGIAENINTLNHPVHMDATQADKCIYTEAHLPPFSLMITLTPPSLSLYYGAESLEVRTEGRVRRIKGHWGSRSW